jgi:hypothetical protein
MDNSPEGHRPGLFRAVLTADGRPGPIEERLGRRLVRIVDPESAEGRHLLQRDAVLWIAPGGDALGRMSAREAVDTLRRRLEDRLADPVDDDEHGALREGLSRLRDRWSRVGRA